MLHQVGCPEAINDIKWDDLQIKRSWEIWVHSHDDFRQRMRQKPRKLRRRPRKTRCRCWKQLHGVRKDREKWLGVKMRMVILHR